MALAKKTSNSSRTVVVAFVIMIVAVIGYFLYHQFFLKSDGNNSNAALVNPSQSVITDFGEGILNDSRFTNLKTTPVNINADANRDGGQPNPFQ